MRQPWLPRLVKPVTVVPGVVCVAQLAMGVDAKPILKTVAEAITHICHSDFPVCSPTACARMCHASRHRSGLERVCVRCGLAGQLAGVPGCAGGEPEARRRATAGAQRAWLDRRVPSCAPVVTLWVWDVVGPGVCRQQVLVILRRVSKKYEFCERAVRVPRSYWRSWRGFRLTPECWAMVSASATAMGTHDHDFGPPHAPASHAARDTAAVSAHHATPRIASG